MVCSITHATLKDGVVIEKTFHPDRSFGDGNEITRDPYTRPWVGSPTSPQAIAKSMSRNARFETRYETLVRGMRGGMVHKMQRPRA